MKISLINIWEKYFRTNVLAVNGLSKYYLYKMLKKDGRIIFIASESSNASIQYDKIHALVFRAYQILTKFRSYD